MKIYLDGDIVPEHMALVPVTDRGFLYGDGVFETMRSYGGEVYMAERHIRRLWRSAGLLGIDIPLDEEGLLQAVNQTLEANALQDALVRVTISRGIGPRGIDPTLEYIPTMVIMAWPFKPYDAALFKRGVHVITALTRRTPPSALDTFIKSCNYLNNIIAKGEASRVGAFEALLLNQDGYLAEGTICNVFFVKGGELRTPSLACGILDGITREHVISLARGMGITVAEGMYTPEQIYSADEVFLTNTSMEVMPVSRLDKTRYPVGTVTRQLMKAYKESMP